MSLLMIGPDERAAIGELKAVAAAQPFDAREAIEADRVDGVAYHDMMNVMSIVLPLGYHVTYSHEIQPSGLYQHISISVEPIGKAPTEESVNAILAAFGMRPARRSTAGWVETLDSGIKAVNVLQEAAA
jgi:hypothetical protein